MLVGHIFSILSNSVLSDDPREVTMKSAQLSVVSHFSQSPENKVLRSAINWPCSFTFIQYNLFLVSSLTGQTLTLLTITDITYWRSCSGLLERRLQRRYKLVTTHWKHCRSSMKLTFLTIWQTNEPEERLIQNIPQDKARRNFPFPDSRY